MGARSGRRHVDRIRGDDGLSMVVTAVGLVVVAVLVLLAARATLGSNGSSTGSAANPGVALADHLQAQQTLSTALAAASNMGAGSGTAGAGIGGIDGGGGGGSTGGSSATDVPQLSAADPSITFVAGPTTGATTVSVAADPSAPGEVTLATRSADGVCWLVWHSPGSVTWYGAQSHLASCAAPVLSSPPSPGPVSPTAIGWQTGSFPPA
jgi:hypothetical protein